MSAEPNRRLQHLCGRDESRKSADLMLVEAGGIEPPSEGLPATITTRLVRGF